jgi:hypothetical protein
MARPIASCITLNELVVLKCEKRTCARTHERLSCCTVDQGHSRVACWPSDSLLQYCVVVVLAIALCKCACSSSSQETILSTSVCTFLLCGGERRTSHGKSAVDLARLTVCRSVCLFHSSDSLTIIQADSLTWPETGRKDGWRELANLEKPFLLRNPK